MKRLMNRPGQVFFLFLLFSMIMVSFIRDGRAEPVHVAIIPFKINAQQDLAYLQNGIADMLASRIFMEQKVHIIDMTKTQTALSAPSTGVLNDKTARNIGARLKADWVLFGSLTMFGKSMSIDAKMVDVTGNRSTLSFFDQSQDMSQVISTVNSFAMTINQKIFGRAPAAEKRVEQQRPVRPIQSGQSDIYAHPEKLIQGGFKEEADDHQMKYQDFMIKKDGGQRSRQFWKSASVNVLINGMALGDVDQDGRIETVLITPDRMMIYKKENKRFIKISETPQERYKEYIGVDLADINRNGIPEIFISALNILKNEVQSLVYEFDGQHFKKIVENSDYFFRVVRLPLRGEILIGQKVKRYNPYEGEVYEMIWESPYYVEQAKVISSKGVNLLGTTIGDVLNNNQETIAGYNEDDHIRIIDSSGEILWTGSDHYGGSTLHYLMPIAESEQMENRKYLPMRILVADPDGDGKYEVICANNHEITGKLLKDFRRFTKAEFVSLAWDGLGLSPVWSTRKISGRISDFAVGDFDNDGKNELVAVVVIKEGSVIGTKAKSAVISYDLAP